MHPVLRDFFNNTHIALTAAMRTTQSASSATKGASREAELGRLFGALLPPLARIECGDLIDSEGHTAGQVDGVLVHQHAPVASMLKGAHSIILAEGAIAVLKTKSNLKGQWDEVVEKWKGVASIRRGSGDPGIPFIVVGLAGWRKSNTLRDHVRALVEKTPPPKGSMVMVACLDPPLMAWTNWEPEGLAISALKYFPSHQGRLLAAIWVQLSERSRQVLYQQIPWEAYLNYGDTPSEKIGSSEDATEQASEDDA